MTTMLSKISCSARGTKAIGRVAFCVSEFRNFSADAYNRVALDSESRERSRSVTSFYYQPSIDAAAAQPSRRLTPENLLYMSHKPDGSHLLDSARYLHKELPIRIAHRISGFRNLPFIVGCCPSLLEVHEMYIQAFNTVSDLPEVKSFSDEELLSKTLRELLDDHRNVITMLAEGFLECRKHIKTEDTVKQFLDRTLTSRLGIRLLCEHHLALKDAKPNHNGIIDVNFSPCKLVEKKAEFVRSYCDSKYGKAPQFRVQGHKNASFAYIAGPLDYILVEILKNAFRATVESHINSMDNLPPVTITIANNDTDFIYRISDRGGGVPHDLVEKIWRYNFTTSGTYQDENENQGLFTEVMNPPQTSPVPGKMHGYGFGLPVCRAYAEYLGGSLTMETAQGFGTDVYLRLRHIHRRGKESFYI